jgi:hypothetical protein
MMSNREAAPKVAPMMAPVFRRFGELLVGALPTGAFMTVFEG